MLRHFLSTFVYHRNNAGFSITIILHDPVDVLLKQRNLKIPKGQTEIVKSEDGRDQGKQNGTKDKNRTLNTTLKTKAGVTRTLQKPG